MTTSSYFAVDASTNAGQIAYWRMSGPIDPDRLAAAWEAAGLDANDLPELPSCSTALNRAVRGLQRGRQLVRPMTDRGDYTVVSEQVNGDDLTYNPTLRVKLDAVGRMVCTPADHPMAMQVRAAYAASLNEHDTADVASWLVWILGARCDAVALRDKGGVYFVPPGKSATWDTIADAVRAASAHRIFKVPALMSRDVLDAVLDAVEREAQDEADAMLVELTKATDGVSDRVGEARLARCDEVEQKVTRYEELLGTRLDGIREKMGTLRANLAAAMMAKAAAAEAKGAE